MNQSYLSKSYLSEKDFNTTSKPNKSQKKQKISKNKNPSQEEDKYCYKTPYNSKNEDLDYSKMEMPISYQLTNGRCIRLKNSQQSISYYEDENNNMNLYEKNVNNNNNININVESKSSDSRRIDYNDNFNDSSLMTIKNGKLNSRSNSKNSLISYARNNYVYPMKFIKHHKKKLSGNASQDMRKGSKSEKKTYKKFNLMINPSYKYNKKFISSPIHKYLPYCKKDDEKYKNNLINYIRTEAPNLSGGAKSTTGIYAKYIKSNENEKAKGGDIYFYLLKKKKKIYSTEKIFAVEKNLYNYCLIDGKNKVDYNHPKKFRFYFDVDIGFNHSWQSPLIVANGDDDVETDDEVLSMAEEKCRDDLDEGINTWNKSSRLCRNYVIAKKFNKNNKIVKTPCFIRMDKNKICGINKNENQDFGKKNGIEYDSNDNVSFGKDIYSRGY